jgi:hypothetical protein
MILFHRTTNGNAAEILRAGFRDSQGHYLTSELHLHLGVWCSDVPLDENEGACGDTLLRISLDLAEDEISTYEWIEEGIGYRSWLLPAGLANAHTSVQIDDVRTLPVFPPNVAKA